MCKVSVVVPTYNSITYIEECITSILEQELEDIEVLIVDAGSEDGTAEFVQKLVDERVHLIPSAMKSYGHQVNLGIAKASAEYVAIVESDDYITQEGIRQCYEKAKEHQLDIVKADFMIFITDNQGRPIYKRMEMFTGSKRKFYDKCIQIDMYPELLQKDRYLWKGLYRRKFLVENCVLLNETAGAAFQDVGFLFHTLTVAKRIMYTQDFMYCYRKDNDSSSVYSVKGIDYLANEFSFLLERMRELYGDAWNKYLPYAYATLMQMTNTRHRLFALMNVDLMPNEESIRRIAEILKASLKDDRTLEAYQQTIRRDSEFFIRNYHGYRNMIQSEMCAVASEYKTLMRRILPYKEIILCGIGGAACMLEMLLCKEGYSGRIVKCDMCAEVVREGRDCRVLVICNMDSKYEMKYDLIEKYWIAEEKIVFYELGEMQYLLKLKNV